MATDVNRIPDRAEVERVLERYFASASAADIDRLSREVSEVQADLTRAQQEDRSFRANSIRYQGLAWKEELARGHTVPTLEDLIAWIATTREGYPRPRPYCPEVYLGTWLHATGTWTFEPGGRFLSTMPDLDGVQAWRTHRQSARGHLGDELWLYENEDDDPRILQVQSIGEAMLVLDLIGGAFDTVRYELTR